VDIPEVEEVDISEVEKVVISEERVRDTQHNCGIDTIMKVIREQEFSLLTFLMKLFSNECPNIRQLVSTFFAKGGPAKIFDFWVTKMPVKYRSTLSDAAVNFVSSKVERELKESTADENLRFPAKSVTSGGIQDFSRKFILARMRENAPILRQILRNSLDPHNEHLKGAKAREINLKVMTVYSILLHEKSQRSNYLQMLMGVFLFSTECHKDVIHVLAKSGLCVAYSTIRDAVGALHTDAIQNLRKVVTSQGWMLVHDNINIASRKGDQRSNNRDTFENGTTGSVIVKDNLAFLRPSTPLALPDIKHFLLNNKEVIYLKNCSLLFLTQYLSSDHDATLAYRRRPLDLLELKKTEIYPLPTLKIDQSTVEGNVHVIEEYRKILELSKEFFEDLNKFIIDGGDQLTKERLDSAIFLRSIDDTRYDRLEWLIPMLQLFHLQMSLCRKLVKNYFGATANTPGSLHSIIILLGTKRVNQDVNDFHAAEELLIRFYEAIKFRLWWNELCPAEEYNLEEFGASDEKRDRLNKLVDGLSPEDIKCAAKNIIDRCFGDSNDRVDHFGHVDRNLLLFFRDMTVYMEFRLAVKEGDIKRMECMLKCINLMLQVKGTHKYARELMLIMYAINCLWTPEEQRIYFSSWVVNTKGSANSWCPADLLQEHINKIVKEFIFRKGSDLWDMLWNLTPNIRTYNEIKMKFKEAYEVSFNSSTHSRVKMEKDINLIMDYFDKHNILRKDPHINNNAELFRDLISEGGKELMSGGFAKFVNHIKEDNVLRSQTNGSSFEPDNENDELNGEFNDGLDGEPNDSNPYNGNIELDEESDDTEKMMKDQNLENSFEFYGFE
ncbi:hypothetical protein BGZ76_003615, partial [Entomortierella beljakovae]